MKQYLSIDYIKEKWNHAGFQKYFQNTGWMLVSKILSMFISLLTTIYVVRNLGPENYGQLSYAVSFVGIFSFIATLGLDNILYRELIQRDKDKSKLMGSALILKLIAGIIAILICVGVNISITKDTISSILITILSGTFIFNAFQIINFEFQANIKSKYPSIISLIVTLIINSLKIIVISIGQGIIYIAAVLLLESILYMILYLLYYKKHNYIGNIKEWVFDKYTSIVLIKDSIPLVITSAFTLIYSRIDQVFIKHMIDAHAVGIYDSAVRVAEVWYFIPGIIVTSLFPAIINAKKISEEQYFKRLLKLAVFLFILATSVAIMTTWLSPYIINLLYGKSFNEATIILQIYVWAGVGMFLNILVNNYLIVENKRLIIILTSSVPMIINIALNIILIPKYNIVGSAYATLISYSIAPFSILLFRDIRRKIINIYR